MNSFDFYTPTKVYFGKNRECEVGGIIASHGYKRVLLHYGGKSAEKSGLLDRIEKSLSDGNVSYVKLGGVKPNPRLSLVEQGIELCKKEGVDFILAVGGGSVIDSSKAIALGLKYNGEVWDFFCGKATPKYVLPFGCVLTISAAGSEMSNSCVISNEQSGEKRGCRSDLNRPLFAIMNPELTYTLPKYQTACGIVDIMMHTLERFFSSGRGNALTDVIALNLLKVVIENGKKCMENPYDYDARSEIMWAGSLSHNNLTGLGSSSVFVCHPIEHELSAMFDVAHGAGLAVVFPAWAKYIVERDVVRFAEYARVVWGVSDVDDDVAAKRGIALTEEFFRSLDMPYDFTSLGIGVQREEVIEALTNGCTQFGKRKIGDAVPLTSNDISNIFMSINH